MAAQAFPRRFLWGVATSAQQIEGGRHEDGRRDSIWDAFAATPGRIRDGSNPDVACDHYHRWRDDIALMSWLGVGAYRFSISWPRVLPLGRGQPNPAGLDFYDALIDGLLEAGIEPFPTLYHWDLPQTLQDEGGWARRGTAEAFVEYTTVVMRRLGDRVGRWVTHNEPWCAATLGHEEGHHAPGHRDAAEALRVAHHLLLSHGWATAAIRREAPLAEAGIVLIHSPAHAASESAADGDAARWYDGFFNRWYLDPVFRGTYPADAIADRIARGHLADAELPFVRAGDMRAISAPLDFLGLNYYSRTVLRAGADGRPTGATPASPEQLTTMGWEVYPSGLHESLLRVHREYGPRAIYITENGAAFDDPADATGRIVDEQRIRYLQGHLQAAHRALQDGVPLRGYFLWSLMDNFEWGYGYEQRFGILAVDRTTQDRTPKESALWYRGVIAANSIANETSTSTLGESHASTP